MSQKKSERLTTLKKLAEWREKDAATAVGKQQQRLQAEHQQLHDLQHYYQGYLTTIDDQTKIATAELVNYRSFCQQLFQTIRQGEQRILGLQRELEYKKNTWVLCRNKRQVLEEMITRCEVEENQLLEKNAQRELDENWLAHRHSNIPNR